MTLLAYHGAAALKKATVAEMTAHRKADRLVKGQYWEGGKGCAVGCLIKSNDHSLYEPRFGIPTALARLEDLIFESLSNVDALRFPERFLKAPQPGADLSLVQWQFLAFVVDEALSRKEAESVREVCQPALEVVRAKARGEPVSHIAAWSVTMGAEDAAVGAESAAECSAAESAAAGAWSAAWSASWSAESARMSASWCAESAERASWCAAESAAAEDAERAEDAAANAAESAAWKRYADKLVALMAEAPVLQPADNGEK